MVGGRAVFANKVWFYRAIVGGYIGFEISCAVWHSNVGKDDGKHLISFVLYPKVWGSVDHSPLCVESRSLCTLPPNHVSVLLTIFHPDNSAKLCSLHLDAALPLPPLRLPGSICWAC
jgi:hypothetical protein